MPYAVGQKIRVIEMEEPDYGPRKGAEGVIVKVREPHDDYDYLVEFDGEFNGGHAGDEDVRTVNGWWVYHSHIELVEDEIVLPFYLVAIIGGKEVPLPDLGGFADGKSAGAAARSATTARGYKVQPRRLAAMSSDTWKAREQARIEDGTYMPLPADWDLPLIPNHFLHRSKDDPTKVVFTESHEKGVLDRQTRIRPGVYLERFHPTLTDMQRKKYIAVIDGQKSFKLATTAEDIVRVYLEGPESCMSHKVSDYATRPIHPVSVYGDSDLSVAYLETARGISARVLIWEKEKIYGRIYGDYARLQRALENEGYTDAGDSYHRFKGARIRAIEFAWDGKPAYVMPYVDGFGMVKLSEDGQWLELCDYDVGNVSAQGTNGVGLRVKTCPKYGGIHHLHDFEFVHGANQEWCRSARESYGARVMGAKGAFEWWDAQFLVRMHSADSAYWTKERFAAEGFADAYDGRNYPKSQGRELSSGDWVTNYNYRHHTVTCEITGRRFIQGRGVIISKEGLAKIRELMAAQKAAA